MKNASDTVTQVPQGSELAVYLQMRPLARVVYKAETQQWITKLPRFTYAQDNLPSKRLRMWDINGKLIPLYKIIEKQR